MNRLPPASTDTPVGPLNFDSVAGPPSPEKPDSHWPAIVLMIPLTETLRTVLRTGSAMYRLPVPSTASPDGTPMCASVAGPAALERGPVSDEPLPAIVAMIPLAETLRIRR